MNDPLIGLSPKELAVLYATRESENVQTLRQLAQNVEAPIGEVGEIVDRLCEKKILEEWNSVDESGKDAICYGYSNESLIAQRVYEAIHGVDPIE